jgi:hypothetical protein
MVLGPLPVTRWTIVRAKLAAMAALLLGTSLSINLLTAVPFAMAANGPDQSILRHIGAHLIAASYAALLMFSAVVILRALVAMLSRGHVASMLGSLLQFTFVAALLCFFVLAPTTADIATSPRGRRPALHLATLPEWLPSTFFLPMYEQLRGTSDPWMPAAARQTAFVTLALAGAAALLTVLAYRRQCQVALSPAASPGPIGGAYLGRALARVLTGRNRIARATADFALTSIARNRAQQAPIAVNAAIGLALVVVKLAPGRSGISPVLQNPALVLAIPMVLVYWAAIGVRASFFIPADLKASWAFRSHAPASTSAYALGTRAAVIALTALPALVGAFVTGWWVGGQSGALLHGAFVLLLTIALADLLVVSIGQMPFTFPYAPGHAKLRTRWPLYFLGAIVFGDRLAALERRLWSNLDGYAILLAIIAAAIVALEWGLRQRGRRWRIEPGPDEDEDESEVTVLGLGYTLHPAMK